MACWGAMLLLVGCFAFMFYNLFLIVEVNVGTSVPGANIISMVREHLGFGAEILTWFAYSLFLYAVIAAYLPAVGSLLATVMGAALHHSVSVYWGIALFLGVFGVILYAGVAWIDLVNRFLTCGLILTYLVLVILVMPHVKMDYLVSTGEPRYLWSAAPVVVLSFTAHMIVPTLREYFADEPNGDRQLKRSMCIGGLIPLIVFVIWVGLLVGLLPLHGPESLLSIANDPQPVSALVHTLGTYLHRPTIGIDVGVFSFFALVTSFLGVAMSLFDFLADGLRIDKHVMSGRIKLLVATLLPPLAVVLFFPGVFVVALSYAGVLIILLYGIFPSLMAWRIRYKEKKLTSFRAPGGKFVLFFVPCVGVGIILLQLLDMFSLLPQA